MEKYLHKYEKEIEYFLCPDATDDGNEMHHWQLKEEQDLTI